MANQIKVAPLEVESASERRVTFQLLVTSLLAVPHFPLRHHSSKRFSQPPPPLDSDNKIIQQYSAATTKMGIKQLFQIIKEEAPDAIKEGEIKNQFGRKVAIVCVCRT